MLETLIVADDLSGAADCAIACVDFGAETLVVIDPNGCQGGVQVISADANSRAMAPHDAGIAVAKVIEQFYAKNTRILYHKMDSTLRGNWATEVVQIRNAVATAVGYRPLAIIAPAFPAAGRTTSRGRVLVNDVPLEKTEIWRHEGLRGPASAITPLALSGLKLETATLDQVAQGTKVLRDQFLNWWNSGCEAVICDAQTEDDLRTIAAASLLLPEKPLWVGSAGLMRALIRVGETGAHSPSTPVQAAPGKPVLTVVGSASGTSRAQFEALIQRGGVTPLTIPPTALRPGADPSLMQSYILALDEAFRSGTDIGVIIDGSEKIARHEGPQLTASLAGLLAPRLSRIGGLVVTGGETARAILAAAGIKGLRMKGEIETGVPFGTSVGSVSVPVITKAGAFGDPMTLVRCRATLRADGIDSSILRLR